jgi:MFS family permease
VLGLVLFTGASLLCAVAQSPAMLIGARFLQGAGGALTSAVILGMVVTMFPEPREQAKAIGIYGFVAAGGGSIGLLAGGVLTEAINWHWIFFINLPIGLATAVFALRLVEDDEGIGLGRGADLPGAALVTAALMLGVYTIIDSASLALGAASLALLAAFVVRQARAATPLMPLRMFRSRDVSGANLVQALSVAGMFGMFFLGALYLQREKGYDSLEVGLAFLPATLAIGALSVGFSERVIMRIGARTVLVPSLAAIAAGLLVFTYAPTIVAMLLMGAGAGLAFPALMTLAMSGVAPDEAGLASGLVNTSVQVGGALGLAVLATLAGTHGYRFAFVVAAGLVVAAIAVAATVLRAPAPSPGVVARLDFEHA